MAFTFANTRQGSSSGYGNTNWVPRPVYFKGIKYNSKLKSRYAQALDTLGIKFIPRGYRINFSDGQRDTPDFWIPVSDDGKTGYFLYVKGRMDNDRVQKVATALAEANRAKSIRSITAVCPFDGNSKTKCDEEPEVELNILGVIYGRAIDENGAELVVNGSKTIFGKKDGGDPNSGFLQHRVVNPETGEIYDELVRLYRCGSCGKIFFVPDTAEATCPKCGNANIADIQKPYVIRKPGDHLVFTVSLAGDPYWKRTPDDRFARDEEGQLDNYMSQRRHGKLVVDASYDLLKFCLGLPKVGTEPGKGLQVGDLGMFQDGKGLVPLEFFDRLEANMKEGERIMAELAAKKNVKSAA